MPLQSQPISSLLNGISQQPAALRHPSQGELQENCLSSLAVGLEKRPPLTCIARVRTGTLPSENLFAHFINRGNGEAYWLVTETGDLQVYNVDGTAATVTVEERAAASLDGETGTTVDGSGFAIWVPLSVTTITLASTLTSTGTVIWERADDAAFTVNVTTLRTDTTTTSAAVAWANNLRGKYVRARITANGGTIDADVTWRSTNYLAATDPRAHMAATTISDYTFIANTALAVTKSGNVAAGSLTGSVQTFSDLPGSPSDGQVYHVLGDDTTDFDDYYVVYSASDTAWLESVKPGLDNDFATATMPHTLVNTALNAFTFGPGAWESRITGDEQSAPDPSFVGETIQDIALHRNRLVFLAGENVILSRTGNAPGGLFAFYPESVQAVLDTDPIDKGVPHLKVSLLKKAVTFDKALLLFSEETQFVLRSTSGPLTPRTADVDPATDFNTLTAVRPVAVGANAYFPTDNGDHVGIREYFVDNETVTNDAADITAHAPRYIPAGVFGLAGSTSNDMLAVLTSGDANALYVYKFLWDDERKAQASWSRWVLDAADVILGVAWRGPALHVVTKRADGIHLDRFSLNDDASKDDLGVRVNLDQRTSLTGSYFAGTGKTTWTLPYDIPAGATADVVLGSGFGSSAGVLVTTTSPTASTLEATGDYSAATAWVGIRYTQRYRFSEQFVRRSTADGRSSRSRLGGRLQLKRMRVRFEDTAYFEVHVTPKARETAVYRFTGHVLGDAKFVFGQLNVFDGEFPFTVMARSSDVTIDLVNDSWLPATFLNAQWTGTYSPKQVP